MLVLLYLGFLLTASSRFTWRHQWKKLGRCDVNSPENWFTQPLDHFNATNKETWKQRYFVNDAYYKPGGPDILFIGGEWTEDGSLTCGGVLVTYAQQLNARLWALEHRFYGESQPRPNQSVEDLKYLSSRQALEDLANFIRSQTEDKRLNATKWILVGASYSASLALWSRVLHPNITIGALASSGPIDIRMDFYGYLKVNQDSIRNRSAACAENIGAAFEQLDTMLDRHEDRARLQKLLDFSPALHDNLTSIDRQEIFHAFIGYFLPAQYGDIKELCQEVRNSTAEPISHIKTVVGSGKHVNYSADVEYLKWASEDRAWTWQTCTEFGWFQTTAFEENIYGVGLPADFFYSRCSDIFGDEYDVDHIQEYLQKTRELYGEADEYNGTNVVIPYGSIDPWHPLGTFVNGTGQFSFLIEGTTHCADLDPQLDTDVPGLKQIRQITLEKMKEWVENSDRAEEKAEEWDETVDTLLERPFEYKEGSFCIGCGGKEVPEEPRSFGFYLIAPKFLHQGDYLNLENENDQPVANTFVQLVDHFNDSDYRYFEQKYYFNDAYYKPGGPLFLYIGGEGALGSGIVFNESFPLVQYAKEVNAGLYALEHRFYGQSHPTSDLSVESLKYLTSQQALADLAYFIQMVNHVKRYIDPQWITFGGSYPGALSAWFRAKYPELTVGTIGSSGPVEAKVDFFEYLQVVENSTINCREKIKEGFDLLRDLLTTEEGREEINDILLVTASPNIVYHVEPFDEMNLYDYLYYQFTDRVQYGKNIAGLCEVWNNDTIEVLNKFVHGYVEISFDGSMQLLNNTSYDVSQNTSRQWLWQVCNEFGFFQTSDIGYNTFGSGVPVNFFIETCRKGFDPSFTRDKIEANVKKTQRYYGGARKYKATNHLHIQGTGDPWHVLGFYTDNEDHGKDVRTFLVDGTSHCADLNPETPEDPEGLKEARKLTLETIKRWIYDLE
ncbi:unnamed protein product [Bursaphelenchus xylophilus]|uniref:(pine wood nematode) hypothetical protein n=1 Tax=Bursaphelenchus xylophilus TaxID=6326 RepID=A0A1I7RJZ7_BURXY|nr:unnamed protein product [Bursaphelenchus xylophilus]CAG9131613.1 unnamed protein product [Bursaphelenchus xylophilus]